MRHAVRPERKAEVALREIAAHQQRAGGAEERPGEDVARIMRGHREPARRDRQRIDPQHRARARPQRAEGDQHRKYGGGVAGGQARIGRAPDERREQVRIEAAADQRPGAADHALDDGDGEAGHADRQEEEADAHHHRRQHRLRHAREPALVERGQRQEQEAERPQEPAGFAVVGDLVEAPGDPVRQALHGSY